MITVKVDYTNEELIQLLVGNMTESHPSIDLTRISKADLQLFAEQFNTLRLVDNRTGAPLGLLTRKLVLRRIQDILQIDPPDPEDPDNTAPNTWTTTDW